MVSRLITVLLWMNINGVSRGVPDMMVSRGVPDMIVSRGVQDMMVSRGVQDMIVSRGVPDMMVSRGVLAPPLSFISKVCCPMEARG